MVSLVSPVSSDKLRVVAPPLGLLDIAGQVLLEADSTAVCEFVVLAFAAGLDDLLEFRLRQALRVVNRFPFEIDFHNCMVFAKVRKLFENLVHLHKAAIFFYRLEPTFLIEILDPVSKDRVEVNTKDTLLAAI